MSYTLSIRVLNKNKVTSLYPETFFPFFSLSLAVPQAAFLCCRAALLIHPPMSFHKAAQSLEDAAIMWKQVPQAVAPVVKKECLTLLSRPKPYWMRALWRQRIFFYIKRAFFKNILWGQQSQAPCSWQLAELPCKATSPFLQSHTFSYPAAPQASSQQHTLPARLPWDNSPQQISIHYG